MSCQCCLTAFYIASFKTLTFLKEGKFTGLGIDSFAAEGPAPERPRCSQAREGAADQQQPRE